jgi:hypothetical protein
MLNFGHTMCFDSAVVKMYHGYVLKLKIFLSATAQSLKVDVLMIYDCFPLWKVLGQ